MSKTKPQQYSAERTEELLHAAAEGDALAVEALLGAGAYINGTNYNLQTALIRAAFFGHVEVVRLLLSHGADVEGKDKLGLTAFDWSIKRGYPEVAQLLPATAAAMATTLEMPPQPELVGIPTPPLTEHGEHDTPPEQREDSATRLDGAPTRQLLYTSAFTREMERQQEELDEPSAPTQAEFPAQPPDDPPTRPLSEFPTQLLQDPPTRPLARFATQQLDDPSTRPLGEFAAQLGDPPTRPLGEPPLPAKPVELEPLPITAPLSEGTFSSEGASKVKPARRNGRALTWVILAITALAGVLAAYLINSRRPIEPVPDPAVSKQAPVPGGAFAGSEASLKLGKSQAARSPETTTPNTGTSSESPGVATYPLVKGAIKGSEISLPDLEYPAAARGGWRRGLINVAISVGGDGNVVTARPLNGPWLWRKAAESAAQKAKFKPQQEASLRSGMITYHFGPLGQS